MSRVTFYLRRIGLGISAIIHAYFIEKDSLEGEKADIFNVIHSLASIFVTFTLAKVKLVESDKAPTYGVV